MKTIIKNAFLIDGTGTKGYAGELTYENGIITQISKGTISGDFDRVIDAKGHTVCPGFIDTHSHSDVEVLLGSAILPKLHQGITTEVLGQDGISVAPVPTDKASEWRKNIGGLDGDSDTLPWDYTSTKKYLDSIEAMKPCANFAYLAPHGNIRMEVMGVENRYATEEELQKMEQLLREELEAGAIGMSTGLIYIPCVYGATEELIRLCKVVKEYNKIFVVHQRSEGDFILDSMDELYQIVKESRVDLHISHFKIFGKRNAKYFPQVLEKLQAIQELGVNVTVDQYPYVAGSTMMAAILPPWAHEGGTDKLLWRLGDPQSREKIKDDILHNTTHWEDPIECNGFDSIVVTSVTKPENQKFVGKNIEQIGEMTGKDPVTAAMDLLLDENNLVGMIEFYRTDDVMEEILKLPVTNVCTDGLLGGTPHPRVYGAFPKILGRFVREQNMLTLEDAIHKMTGQAAKAMHFTDRGILAVGKKADINIFDPDTIIDVGTYENPRQYAKGFDKVIINGTIVLENDTVNENAASGEVIRL